MEIRICAFADEAGKMLSEQIDALKRNNINLLELRNVDGQNVADISLEKAQQIKKTLDKENIKVFSIGSPLGKINITDSFETHLKTLNHILDIAKIFACDKIRMFSFFTQDFEKDRNEVLRRLAEMVKIAAKDNIGLYHENEKDIYGDCADRVSDILNNVPDLKSIYDPANYIQSGEAVEYSLQETLQKADYLHIKDVISATGELVPAGYGDCKIKEILTVLKGHKVLTIEPHLALFDGYAKFDNREMKSKFQFASGGEAFDAACSALTDLLEDAGFEFRQDRWIKG